MLDCGAADYPPGGIAPGAAHAGPAALQAGSAVKVAPVLKIEPSTLAQAMQAHAPNQAPVLGCNTAGFLDYFNC